MFYVLIFFADMSEEREIYELRDHRTVQLPVHRYEAQRGCGTAIVIDNGGQEVRPGGGQGPQPCLQERPCQDQEGQDHAPLFWPHHR